MDARIAEPLPDEAARFPHLSEHGRAMVRLLTEHPRAPIFRNTSGHRLTRDDLAAARAWHEEALGASIDWRPNEPPPWVDEFASSCFREVPHWRRFGARPHEWAELPTSSRADLARDIAAFVPDTVPTDRLFHFSTSGTTGDRLVVPSHPLVAARYLAFHLRALRQFGLEPRAGRNRVGVMLLGYQRKCFTYASVTPLLDESGLAKINLHPGDWRHPDDRAAYLDAMAPEFLAGDPLSFAELLRLESAHRPRALLSTSMALLPGLRAALEQRFRCPVLDLYSMNEAGPIGVLDPAVGGHLLLQHRLFVEILDPAGSPLPPGRRGEITLTGGFNFCLPLLRYRTGDYASLGMRDGTPVLTGLEGRPPVRFRTRAGDWVNNVDVSHALAALPLPRFALHQQADGSLVLRLPAGWSHPDGPRAALTRLFGPGQPLAIETLPYAADKVVQYTSALAEASGGHGGVAPPP